ncbi:hypothetical protein [Geodermatophilus sp. URMC 63]
MYELAVLAEEPRRAVETAVIALAEAGMLRVDRSTGGLVLVERRPCSDREATGSRAP